MLDQAQKSANKDAQARPPMQLPPSASTYGADGGSAPLPLPSAGARVGRFGRGASRACWADREARPILGRWYGHGARRPLARPSMRLRRPLPARCAMRPPAGAR